MKKTLFLFTLLLFFTQGIFAQWSSILDAPQRVNGISVQGRDTITAIALHSVIRSADAGQTWDTIAIDSTFSGLMYDIVFPTTSVGYICGGYDAFGQPDNQILKSTDGGLSWHKLPEPLINSVFLTQMSFLNADTGLFLGYNGEIFITTDGAATFTAMDLPDTQSWGTTMYIGAYPSIFAATVNMQADGQNGTFFDVAIYRSTDFGGHWTRVHQDTMTTNHYYLSPIINKFYFLNPKTGYAVGGDNTFLKMTDSGKTWIPLNVQPYVGQIQTVFFVDSLTGYINTFDKIQKTTDGGATWEIQDLSQQVVNVSDIVFVNRDTGYCFGISDNFSGNKGFVFKTENGGDAQNGIGSIVPILNIKIFPNPAKNIINLQYNNLDIQSLTLTDLSGRTVKTFSAESKRLNVSGLAAGLYFLQVKAKEGTVVEKVEIR